MGKYLLPDGETLVTGLKCAVVSYPDDPRYRRALWGAISQLTKYWMWEPDGDGGEYDAADSWDEAYNQTLENFDMLDQILAAADAIDQNTDEIEALLRALQTLTSAGSPCCENLGPVDEVHEYDDSVYPDTPPATWGDGEPVADSSDWQELTCGAAHAYVDHLKGMSDQLDEIVTAGAIAVGAIAGLLGILSGAGIILTISYGAAATVVGALLASATELTFGDTADDLEASRQEIVCAVTDGSAEALASAVETAVGTVAWSLFFQFVDYATARNVMLEGSHGSEYLGVNRRTDCECQPTFTDFVIEPIDNATMALAQALESGEDITWSNEGNVWTVNFTAGGWGPYGVLLTWPDILDAAGYYVEVTGANITVQEDEFARTRIEGIQEAVELDTYPADVLPEDAVLMGQASAGAYSAWSTDFQNWYDARTVRNLDFDDVHDDRRITLFHHDNANQYVGGSMTVTIAIYVIRPIT